MYYAKPKRRLGLIGTGFMGRAHAFGFTNACRIFDLPIEAELHSVADINTANAEALARAFGFAKHTADWTDIIADAEIDIVSITAPNALHKEMALAAIAAGKHVYCEKPLAPLATDAKEMADAAKAAKIKTQVGFNYLCNPMLKLARDMIADGALGEIRSYRGLHAEDFMADPKGTATFRIDPKGGGALADLGSHALATAEFLLGGISAVMGDLATHHSTRTDAKGTTHKIQVDDIGRAFLRFENGASGSIEGNWIATGRKMQHDFEVYGSKGALSFSQERLNELHFFTFDDRAGQQGFRKIEAAPEHTPYGLFCPAPGHQLGFNDLKAIEVAEYLSAINGDAPEPFNFRAGLRIQTLVEKIQQSARQRNWLKV